MSLIISPEAQERLMEIAKKLESLIGRGAFDSLMSLIMLKALQNGCIDSDATFNIGGATCAEKDFILFPMTYSSTDFEWILWDRATNKRDFNGGICCHTRWFEEVMDGRSITEAYKESGAKDYTVTWGSHT